MSTPADLEAFAGLAPGQRVVAACVVRAEGSVRHAAVTARRIALAAVALVAVPVVVLALARVGIVWIGAVFVIVPALAFAGRALAGVSRRPTVYRAVLTEHSLLLVDEQPIGGRSVAHAFPRSTLAEVRAGRRDLRFTSAGRRVRLLTDDDDAGHVATLLRT